MDEGRGEEELNGSSKTVERPAQEPVEESGKQKKGKSETKGKKTPQEPAVGGLITEQRNRLIDEAFGVDKGRITPFREEDRGEDRR